MIKKLLSIIATGLFLSSCVTVDRSYLNNADNQMLCEQTWKNLSLETSRDKKKQIRAELTRRGSNLYFSIDLEIFRQKG